MSYNECPEEYDGYEVPARLPKGWHVQFNPKPIPDRRHDYDFYHDNYDGENELSGTALSMEDALEQIKLLTNKD